jgi:hypothetical protein
VLDVSVERERNIWKDEQCPEEGGSVVDASGGTDKETKRTEGGK